MSAARYVTMTTAPRGGSATQVYRIYIKATPQAIWDAITKSEWTERYGYTGIVDFDLRPGGAYTVHATKQFRAGAEAQGVQLPDVIIDGEVVEADPPKRLVHTFNMHMDPAMEQEPATRITYEIADMGNGSCSLTLTHELEGAPTLAAIGHAWVLSDLKSLLETGKTLAG
jgi:uncharacterized protein YndB with AHSA1/START domain